MQLFSCEIFPHDLKQPLPSGHDTFDLERQEGEEHQDS